MLEAADQQRCRTLLQTVRWAALATIGKGRPEASMVAFVFNQELDACYFHLSKLARHTRHLVDNSCVSLVLTETDDGQGDPQELARVSLQGEVSVIEPDDAEYQHARLLYLEHFPAAEMRFQFTDFGLFRFQPDELNYVGGFGRARRMKYAKFLAGHRD